MKVNYTRISSMAIAASLLATGAMAQAQSASSDGIFVALDADTTAAEAAVDAATTPVTNEQTALDEAVADRDGLVATLTAADQAALDAFLDALDAQTATGLALVAANTEQAASILAQSDAASDQSVAFGVVNAPIVGTADLVTSATADRNNAANFLASEIARPTATAADIAAAQALLDTEEGLLATAVANNAAAVADLAAANAALIAANADVVTASQAVVAATTADGLAAGAVTSTSGALNTLLAGNTEFVTAANAAGVAANAAGIGLADTAVTNATATLATNTLALTNAQNGVSALTSASDILVAASTNANGFIEGAASALVDPNAPVNYETQVLGALIDHEDRITTNTADIATNAANIATNAGRITTVDDESRARDVALGERITSETAARTAADEALLGEIMAETTARVAADTALGNRISGVEGRMDNLESRVGVLENRIDSSTAVAIAMGGATFLPGMDFNLSANVATFNGAQAISAAFGARISKNVAVSGAIGHGLNRDGDTGGRVGIIFGF